MTVESDIRADDQHRGRAFRQARRPVQQRRFRWPDVCLCTSRPWRTGRLVQGTNLKGVFLGMKYGIQAMLRNGGGSIVNTASAVGLIGWKGHSIYGAAKAGAIQLTKAAAMDYAEFGIRANAICPGMFWTGLVKGARDTGTVGAATAVRGLSATEECPHEPVGAGERDRQHGPIPRQRRIVIHHRRRVARRRWPRLSLRGA